MQNDGPKYISFHITNRCDCQCSHCAIWQVKEPKAPLVKEFLRVVDDLAQWAGPAELIVAGGEPLLDKATIPIIERGSKNGMTTLLATNGFSIDDNKAKALADAGLSFANISLDGFDHTHDRIRKKPGAFGLVVKAIDALFKHGVPVRICTVILEDNLDQITGLIEFLENTKKVNGIFFQAMAQPFGNPDFKRDWWLNHPHFPMETKRVHSLLDELLAMKRGGHFILNEDSQFPAMKAYFANPEKFTQALCTVGDIGFSINAGGDVLLCSFMEPVGNIKQGSIREIFESEKAKNQREMMHKCKDNCHLLINCSFDPAQLLTRDDA